MLHATRRKFSQLSNSEKNENLLKIDKVTICNAMSYFYLDLHPVGCDSCDNFANYRFQPAYTINFRKYIASRGFSAVADVLLKDRTRPRPRP